MRVPYCLGDVKRDRNFENCPHICCEALGKARQGNSPDAGHTVPVKQLARETLIELFDLSRRAKHERQKPNVLNCPPGHLRLHRVVGSAAPVLGIGVS